MPMKRELLEPKSNEQHKGLIMTTKTREEIFYVIEEDLKSYSEIKEISMDTNLVNDIGLDSLDLIEFIIRIEDVLEIELSDEEIDSAFKAGGRIKDYVDMIENRD